MLGLRLRSRQMFAGMQTRRFSYKFSPVFSPDGSNLSGNDPKVLNQEKQKVFKEKAKSSIETAPGWNEKLASESEATVKADRHDSVSIEELQRQSVSLMEEHSYEPQEQPQSTNERI